MKSLTVLLASGLVWFSALPQAGANNCAQAARQVEQSRNGEVLQVNARQKGGQIVCEVTVRVPGKNGKPPRVVTVRVNG